MRRRLSPGGYGIPLLSVDTCRNRRREPLGISDAEVAEELGEKPRRITEWTAVRGSGASVADGRSRDARATTKLPRRHRALRVGLSSSPRRPANRRGNPMAFATGPPSCRGHSSKSFVIQSVCTSSVVPGSEPRPIMRRRPRPKRTEPSTEQAPAARLRRRECRPDGSPGGRGSVSERKWSGDPARSIMERELGHGGVTDLRIVEDDATAGSDGGPLPTPSWRCRPLTASEVPECEGSQRIHEHKGATRYGD